MPFPVRFQITAPFQVADLVAEVTLDGGGTTDVVLRAGRFAGPLPAQATRLRLTTRPAPAGEAPLSLEDPALPGTPTGALLDIEELFEHGVAIPADGQLAVQLKWGTPCHAEAPPPQPSDQTRFGSWEHILTAELVGLDQDGRTPLSFAGSRADFDKDTLFPVGDKALRFGQIIALAGDFYAHLDEAAATDFAWAWPAVQGLAGWVAGDYRAATLTGDAPEVARDILEIVFRDRDSHQSAAGEFAELAADALTTHYPARRYLALASQNHCHFGAQPWDGSIDDPRNEALRLYRAYHERALRQAAAAPQALDRQAALHQAIVAEAFGCHFLTDLFASGHIRVPRRVLSERFGILKGGLQMAHAMHKEDNSLGLWCTLRTSAPGGPRVIWRAYGDGLLRTAAAAPHLGQVREAVRRSVAEIFAAFCGVPAPDRAEALLPVPLRAGTGPLAGDVLPDRSDGPQGAPNHFPLYALLPDGRVGKRQGGPESPAYQVEGGPGSFVLGGP